MIRHLPTFQSKLHTHSGAVYIHTSAWRATPQPVWIRIGANMTQFSTDEARAIARALAEAADHIDATRLINKDAAA